MSDERISIERILGANFYLPALLDELNILCASRRGRDGIRDALLSEIRTAMSRQPLWPDGSRAGVAALVLALIDNPRLLEVTGFNRFHHANESLNPIKKPTGVRVSRGGGTGGIR